MGDAGEKHAASDEGEEQADEEEIDTASRRRKRYIQWSHDMVVALIGRLAVCANKRDLAGGAPGDVMKRLDDSALMYGYSTQAPCRPRDGLCLRWKWLGCTRLQTFRRAEQRSRDCGAHTMHMSGASVC